jgi:predicted O-methyltransferase YrrM
MPHKSHLPEPLQDYIAATWGREPDILRRLREETATLPSSGYQIPPDQGQLMGLLAALLDAKNCLEIGVYTGYSALSVALALPAGGTIVACDVSEEFTSIAKRYWQEAGVADHIDLQLRPALETLDALLADGKAGTFDFAFIDADKSNYGGYYERVLELLKPNGVILIDNVLWSGRIIDLERTDADTVALRALNDQLRTDERIDLALIPIGDGVTIARKRLLS